MGRLTGPAGPVRPPGLFRVLLAVAVWPADREFLLADLEDELTAKAGRMGRFRARWWYRIEVLRSLPHLLARRPFARGETRSGRHPRSRAGASMNLVQRTLHDLRHAWTAVRRNPRYAAAVVLTFSLAAGANIAVFSVTDGVLLTPLPYHEPDDLVMTYRVTEHGSESGVSLLDFRDWQQSVTSFEAWAAYSSSALTHLSETGAERWSGLQSTPALFDVLGVSPLEGRTYRAATDRQADPVIVLSHSLWTRRFGADPGVVGTAIRFEDRPMTVIGVMPADFYFPTPEEEYWIPLVDAPYNEQRGAWFLQTIGRLAPGVSLAAARSEVDRVARSVAREVDGTDEGTAVRLETRHEAYVGDTRRLFGILLGAVGLVLVIACANIANLGLTHATRRRRELAVRAALGAGSGRLGRQLVLEHVLLACAGAAVGVALSIAVVNGLSALGPEDLPRLAEIGIDWTALAYATLIALLSGVVFGSVPALSGARASVGAVLNEAGRGTLGRGGRRTLGLLVSAQVALAVVLVVGASLLVNSFLRLSDVRPGFDTATLLSVYVDLPDSRYATQESVESFYDDARRLLMAHPGIEAVGFTTHLPLSGSNVNASYMVETRSGEHVAASGLQLEVVGDGYFESAGIPRVAGRDVRRGDGPGAPLVAVINQRFAELHWPNGEALGARFTLDDSDSPEAPWHEVIGVVGNTVKQGLDVDVSPVAYFPRRQFQPTYGIMSGRSGYLTLHTRGDPARAVPVVRATLAQLDPGLPLSRIQTASGLVSRSIAEPRFRTILLGAFAALALLVALVGIYGVIGFNVACRTREIGIRMALGASRGRILSVILRSGAVLLVAGLAIGVAAGLAASRVLTSVLYGISAGDPLTFIAAGSMVMAAGLIACWLPARRASRVEPTSALRED